MQELVNECVTPRAMFVKLQFLNSYLNFIGDGIVFQYSNFMGIKWTHHFLIMWYYSHTCSLTGFT